MPVSGALAIIPKARGMFAKGISMAEYEELMRRRTVPEVAAQLKRHPYFKESLATLSILDPHRGQLEELLKMDIFLKYEALAHYDVSPTSFSSYFLNECELEEIIKIIHFLSIGAAGGYINQMPSYLKGKTRIDLFQLAQVRNYADLLEALRPTVYYRVLKERFDADPDLKDFPLIEATLYRRYYEEVFTLIEKSFSGRDAALVRNLFTLEAEIYNMAVVLRIKTFFSTIYSPEEIRQLLMPYHYRVSRQKLDAILEANSREALLAIYTEFPAFKNPDPDHPDFFRMAANQSLYNYAKHLLHLTSSPSAAIAAFLTLAKLNRENIVNVIEGTRYGLSPEMIRPLLFY